MKRFLLLLALVPALMAGFLVPDAGAFPCGDKDKVLKNLAEKYQEVPLIFAVTTANIPMVITLSPKGTYTMMLAPAANRLCTFSIGHSWSEIELITPEN